MKILGLHSKIKTNIAEKCKFFINWQNKQFSLRSLKFYKKKLVVILILISLRSTYETVYSVWKSSFSNSNLVKHLIFKLKTPPKNLRNFSRQIVWVTAFLNIETLRFDEKNQLCNLHHFFKISESYQSHFQPLCNVLIFCLLCLASIICDQEVINRVIKGIISIAV